MLNYQRVYIGNRAIGINGGYGIINIRDYLTGIV